MCKTFGKLVCNDYGFSPDELKLLNRPDNPFKTWNVMCSPEYNEQRLAMDKLFLEFSQSWLLEEEAKAK